MKNYKEVLDYMKEIVKQYPAPVQQFGAHCVTDTNETADGRLRTLIGLILSAQTKDPVTAQAVFRLDEFLGKKFTQEDLANFKCQFAKDIKTHNLTFDNLKLATVEQIQQLIFLVGFYKKKAVYIKQLENLQDVPKSVDELVKLNGVGYKMAKIATQVCYNQISGIAVDTHVHRITQKLGWAGDLKISSPPNQVMKDLEDSVPRELWEDFNETIVGFGQVWCGAVNPRCSECKLYKKECKWQKQKSRK